MLPAGKPAGAPLAGGIAIASLFGAEVAAPGETPGVLRDMVR
jgi:hypothetical protein